MTVTEKSRQNNMHALAEWIGVMGIGMMVILDNEITNDCRLTWRYTNMFKLSVDVICEEHGQYEVQVP
jgi:hypothetical protein